MYGNKSATTCSCFLSLHAFLGFQKSAGALHFIRHHIAAFNLPTVAATAFSGHILLDTHDRIGAVQSRGIDGITTHIRLKRLIVAGHHISATFLDTELEQTICFDSPLDAESFASKKSASKKSAIFLVLLEEDQTKNFMAGLMIQNLSRELFSVADENGGKLKNRVVLFCDEFGTMPPFDVLSLFSAGRSRKLTMLPIIQSLAQLEKNYGKEGSEIIQDNCQDLRHEVA